MTNIKQILFFIVFILLLVLVFRHWVLSPAIVSGDYWYYFQGMYENHSIYPFSWYPTVVGNGLGGQGFAYQNINMLTAFSLSLVRILNSNWETISKLVYFLPFILLSTFSSSFVYKKLFEDNKFWIVSPVIFVFNTYILMTVGGGQIITALSYSLIPLCLYGSIKLVEAKDFSLLKVSIVTIILSLQTFLDLRIAFVTSLAIALYAALNLKRQTLYVLTVFILVGLINSYWIIPILLFGIDPIAQLGANYSSIGIVKFLSFSNLENSISLLHPYWPENIFGKVSFMRAEFLILPIVSFASFLFVRGSKKKNIVIYLLFLALLGIFLGKGANEPLGGIYLWLFENVPGFQLFRDPLKWFALISVSFSMLIPFVLSKIPEIKIRKFRLSNEIVISVFLLYSLFLLKPFITGEVQGTFRQREIPIEYTNFASYLKNEKEFYRTLWIPQAMQFTYHTPNKPNISARDFFKEYDLDKLVEKISDESSRDILIQSSVKYLVVPYDVEKEIFLTDRKYDDIKYQKVIETLDKTDWLRKDRNFGKIAIYEVEGYRDHFWCECNAKILYKQHNPTSYTVEILNAKEGSRLVFSESFDNKWVALINNGKQNSQKYNNRYNSFKLDEGSYSIEVSYSPQKIVDMGFLISMLTLGLVFSLALTGLVKRAKNGKIL